MNVSILDRNSHSLQMCFMKLAVFSYCFNSRRLQTGSQYCAWQNPHLCPSDMSTRPIVTQYDGIHSCQDDSSRSWCLVTSPPDALSDLIGFT